MIVETEIKGHKAIQHKLLLNEGLFHAHFLRNTKLEDIEGIVGLPVNRCWQKHTDIVEEAPFDGTADGLYTQKANMLLTNRHADCQVAIFWDPKTKLLAGVHAGWRGQVSQIYTKTVHKLKAKGAKPENILVGISPSLGACHGEFKGWQEYFPNSYEPFQVKENYFDLKAIAKDELEKAGIHPRHISIAPQCTFADEKRFHSYRRDKTEERLVTVCYCPARLP